MASELTWTELFIYVFLFLAIGGFITDVVMPRFQKLENKIFKWLGVDDNDEN